MGFKKKFITMKCSTSVVTIVTLYIFIPYLSPVICQSPTTPKKLMWVPFGTVPFKQIDPAGTLDGNVLSPIYVIRGPVDRYGKIPGYIKDDQSGKAPIKIPSGSGVGIGVQENHIKVLFAPRGATSWVAMSTEEPAGEGALTQLPRNVVSGGQAPNTRDMVYVCRAMVESMIIPGVYMPTRKHCIVVDNDGVEKTNTKFEVLTVNDFALLSGAFM